MSREGNRPHVTANLEGSGKPGFLLGALCDQWCLVQPRAPCGTCQPPELPPSDHSGRAQLGDILFFFFKDLLID